MSGPNDEIERKLLNSIKRRNALKTLAIVAPFLVLWRLLIHWLEGRVHLRHDLAENGTLLVIFIGCGIVLPQLGWNRVRDRRETPRLQWSQREQHEKVQSRTRLVYVAALSLMLLLKLGMLLSNQNWSSSDSSSDIIIFLMAGGGFSLLWRLPQTMDELAQAHHLTATQRAYVVTVVSCVSAVLLDSFWSGRLRATITISLLAGVLTQQIGLALLEARAIRRAD